MGSGLLRLLIILIAIWLAFRLIRYFMHRYGRSAPHRTAIPRMLPCARCGVHVPEDQAIRIGDRVYCEDHRPSS